MKTMGLPQRGTILYALLSLVLILVLETHAAGQDRVKVSIDTSRTSGPIDLTRYALGQGGLHERSA